MLRNTLTNLRTVSKNKLRKLVRKYGIINKDEFIHDMQEAGQDDLFGANLTGTVFSNGPFGLANAGQSSRNRWSATTRFALGDQFTNPGLSIPIRQPSFLQEAPVQVMPQVPVPAVLPAPAIDYSDVIIQEASPVLPSVPWYCYFNPIPEVNNIMAIDTSPLIDPEDMEIYTESVSSGEGESMAVDPESLAASSGTGIGNIPFWYNPPQSASFPYRHPNVDGMDCGTVPAFVIVPGDFSAPLKRSLPVGAPNVIEQGFAYVPSIDVGTNPLEQRAPEFPNPGFQPVWRKDEVGVPQGPIPMEMPQTQFPTPMAFDRAEFANPPSAGPASVSPPVPAASNGPTAPLLTAGPPVNPVPIERSEANSFIRPAAPPPTVVPPPVPVASINGRSEGRSSFNHPATPLPAPSLASVSADNRNDGPLVPHNQSTSRTTCEQNGGDDGDSSEDDDEPRVPFEREDTEPLEEGEDKPPAVFLTVDQLPSIGSLGGGLDPDLEQPSRSDEHRTSGSTLPTIEEGDETTPPQQVGQYQGQAHAGPGTQSASRQATQTMDDTIRNVIAQRRLAIRSGQDISLLQGPSRVERDDDDDVRPERAGSAKRIRSNIGTARPPGTPEAELPGPSRRVTTSERRSSSTRWSRTSNEVTPLRSILRNRDTNSNQGPLTDLSSTAPPCPFTFTFGVPDASSATDGGTSSSEQPSIPNRHQESYASEAPAVEQAPETPADSQPSGRELPSVRYTDGPLPPLEDLLGGMTMANGPPRPPRSVSLAVPDGPEQLGLRQRSSLFSREARNRSVLGHIRREERPEGSINEVDEEVETTNERSARGPRVSFLRPSGFNRERVRTRRSRLAIPVVT